MFLYFEVYIYKYVYILFHPYDVSIYIYTYINIYIYSIPQVLKKINDTLGEGETEEGCTRKCEAMMAKLDLHMQRIDISTTDFNLMCFRQKCRKSVVNDS